MERDKRIEEMAKTVCHLDRTCDQCMTSFECKSMTYAKRFYNAGYRKASEVIDYISGAFCGDCEYDGYAIKQYLEELKKKYESENDNGNI